MPQEEDPKPKDPTNEPETYELELPDEDDAPLPPPTKRDLTSSVAPVVDTSSSPGAPNTDPNTTDKPKVSEAVFKPADDPEFVDPEVARMRREDQRKRAAEQAVIEAQAKKKRAMPSVGIIGAVVAINIIGVVLLG